MADSGGVGGHRFDVAGCSSAGSSPFPTSPWEMKTSPWCPGVPTANLLVSLVALVDDPGDSFSLKLAECVRNRLGENRRCCIRVGVSAAIRFRNDFVDHIQMLEIARGEFEF